MKFNILQRFKHSLILASAVAGVALTGCSDENYGGGTVEPAGNNVVIQAVCSEMLPNYIDPETVVSRVSDPKTEAERVINTLHIFFFDQNGEFLAKKYDNFTPYQKITGNVKVIKTGDGDTDVFDQMENVTIVAIANIDATDATGDSDPDMFLTEWTPWGKIKSGTRDENAADYKITDLEKLKKWIYSPRLRTDEGRDLSQLPEAGMPMIGILENVTIKKHQNAQGNQVNNLIVPMTAMMARVDISVKLEPNQESRDGSLPTMTITGYGVKNMPVTVPFTSRTGDKDEDGTYDDTVADVYKNDEGSTEIEVKSGLPVTITKNSAPVRFTYYIYENIQLPDYDAVRPNGDKAFENGELKFPSGVKTDTEKQRWKPTIAKTERASALILKGSYTTHQGLTYQAQFTVYMGANPIDNFMVERNHQYSNNITIHGLDYVRNSEDNVYTFDGRVNVVTDNPLYLAIVNERKVDAHATALPMDVWLLLREAEDPEKEYDWNSTVTISLKDPATGQAPDWIRMKKIPRADMKANNFKPGTGVTDRYFTTTLLDELGEGGKEVVIDGNKDKSRSRVYFYIDENVPRASGNSYVDTYGNPYGDRYATVYITYENNKDGVIDRRERTLEIEQRALIHLDGTWHGNSSWSGSSTINTWMEYYEEYLEHNDPLDMHEAPGELYSGLPWGFNGTNVRSAVNGVTGTLVYLTSDAFIYTKGLVQGSIQGIHLYNEGAPATAFHYCYGRNKRNADGSVPDSNGGWYMPGIRELEFALTDQYINFEDFRGNFYWSASCGAYSDVGIREMTDKARATKVTMNGNSPTYIESTGNNAGSIARTSAQRIRAFYKIP